MLFISRNSNVLTTSSHFRQILGYRWVNAKKSNIAANYV